MGTGAEREAPPVRGALVRMFIVGFKSWPLGCIYTEARVPVAKASGQLFWSPC